MSAARTITLPRAARPGDTALITGGAGFIATNVADRLLRDGWRVRIFDNLSRAGVDQNVRWLVSQHGPRVETRIGDVRDRAALTAALAGVSRVFHFAAQVAVTTSLVDPFLDFEVNARGTLNLLEAVRAMDRPPTVLFTSTNKVYGHLDDVPLVTSGQRYEPADAEVTRTGIGEARPLDFHSPYGCSKGAADQYVLDYARTFGLPATVFRMSCIYGPHQFGTEDQGWVAHFLIQALRRAPLTLYGDGLQVRDVLFVEDLVDAMLRAHEQIDVTGGQAYNIGGGPGNTVSLLELLDLIAGLIGHQPAFDVEPWRPADQRYYVSNTAKFEQATGWQPRTNVRDGLRQLLDWLVESGVANPATVVASRAS
ncbi:MAG TPA: NAD-dependent epimerase/dehydratase family protein [Vicinamibacterales bacterium]|nr:NAD-dependent epimerase/dehydratase family protein [Vicinamibacterales bacterium]